MIHTATISEFPHSVDHAFNRVFTEHQAPVLRTAYRMTGNWPDAEDIAQQVFIRLHRNGLDFPNHAALASWLYRVTVNLCMDQFRSSREMVSVPELPSLARSSESELIREQEKAQLMAALAQLAPRERAAIVLREIEGLSTAEVAEILGSTPGTVRSQGAHAMAHLQAILSGERG